MERELVWIDSEEACREACERLCGAGASPVAVDLEGTDLSRESGFCLLQAACEEGPVYLFDVLSLGRRGFDAGLRQLLELGGPRKLLFDPRADSDALWQQYGVRLGNVLDVQVLYCWAVSWSSLYLPGMAKATADLSGLADGLREELAELKEQGRRLFKPELGGSRAVWEERPLPELLMRYSAADVEVLFALHDELCPQASECRVLEISNRRLCRHLARDTPETGPQRDFPLPADLCTVFVRGGALLARTSTDELVKHFGRYGQVAGVTHRDSSGDYAFAFVEFEDHSGALKALRASAAARHRGPFGSVKWPKRAGAFIADYLAIGEGEDGDGGKVETPAEQGGVQWQ